jgi:hypothetical protein
MVDIPGLKKKVSLFLKSEKGGISKKALVDGAVAAGLVFALAQGASVAQAGTTHSNTVSISVDPASSEAIGSHSNHSSHSSY